MKTRVVEVSSQRYATWRERFDANNPDGPQRVIGVSRFDHDPLVLLLVRRGGYAVGVARGGQLVAHKVGTRYVQSRTAAGGWSQQRFARRRANQADGLVGAAAYHLEAVVGNAGGAKTLGPSAGLILGGDRSLAQDALEHSRLAELATLPTRGVYDLPDPRLDVLTRAVERGTAVHITISE